MSKAKIIVGPDVMFVEKAGVKSQEARLSASDGPAQIAEKAQQLYAEIKPLACYILWGLHRLAMARQRRVAALYLERYPGPYHLGPRPDMVATKPWKQAKHGEWFLASHGVAARLLRGVA